MDIANLSTDMRTFALHEEVGTAVLSKTMDDAETLGAGLVQMIDAAAMERIVNPAVGANIDMYI